MANSPKLLWPYPDQNQDPWYDTFRNMVEAQDVTAYAAREDRNAMLGGDGVVSFDSGTGILASTDNTYVFSVVTGHKFVIAPFSVTIQSGQVLYVDVVRAISADMVLTPIVANNVPNTNDCLAIAVRFGTSVYFRNGSKLLSGESRSIFSSGGGGASSDTYERSATFGVPEGTLTQEATLGFVTYSGSLLAVSAEITRPVTAGTITINVKLSGVTKLTTVLSLTHPTVNFINVASGTYDVITGDTLSVEVVTAGYTNADGLDAGLTLAVSLSNGITVVPGTLSVTYASSTVTGITKLSVDPIVSSNPIAVGLNDPNIVMLSANDIITGRARVSIVPTDATVASPTKVMWQVRTDSGNTADPGANPAGSNGYSVLVVTVSGIDCAGREAYLDIEFDV